MAVQFRCQDVGVACRSTTTAENTDELIAKVREHAKKAHGVDLNETLTAYAVSQTTTTT